jgi:hypothetical protein
MNTPPMSPRDGQLGQQYPPQDRQRPDRGYEQQLVDQMSKIDMNQRQMMATSGRASSDTHRGQGEYGRHPANGGIPKGLSQDKMQAMSLKVVMVIMIMGIIVHKNLPWVGLDPRREAVPCQWTT